MKHIKKMMALALAMVMMVAMAIPAMAASIKITDNDPAGTATTEFVYYELMKASIGTAAEGEDAPVSYYIPNNTDGTALKNLLAAVTYQKTVDGAAKTVTPFSFTESADGTRWNCVVSTDVADSDGLLLATAVNTDAIKAAALATNAADDPNTFVMSNGEASATGLDQGYYLITSSLGTALVLQTLGDEEIVTKNEYITDVKTASKTNMEVGDKVTYTITVHIPATAQAGDEVTVHDTLDSHLAILDSSDAIATSAANYDITAKYVNDGSDVAVTLSDGTKKADTETFAKKFTLTAAMIGKDVIITYDAELLSTAADDTGYVNTTFANDDSYETNPSEVKVYTFDIDLDKTFAGVASDDADDYQATFKLYPQVDGSQGTTAIKFVSDNTGYVIADSSKTSGTSDELTVTGGDAINIRGLAAGTYYLVETATADGFNQLTDPIVVTITDTTTGTQPNITPSHTVSYTVGEDEEKTGTIEVTNQSGSVLPSTGGIGTTIFYVIGAILVLGAGILLVTRRRMNAN